MYPPAFSYPPFPPSHSRSRYDDIPSSDPPEEFGEDVTLFPRLSQWLVELDESRRGADGHNFSQFVHAFEQEKYFRICDVADLSVADICGIINGIAQGTASKLVAYAKQDTELIRKKEKRRGRDKRYNRY
jgi:hypothetical protein